jgi:hypothetical protein
MNEQDRKIEEILVMLSVLLLMALMFFVILKTTQLPFSSITGEVVSRVNVTGLRVDYCNFTLQEDLNLVSFFCIANGAPIGEVMNGFSNQGNIEAVFEYEKGSTDLWKIYNPNLPGFVIQDLHDMSRTKGYWIRTNAQTSAYIIGGLRIPNYIPLTPGWNLVGYPTNSTKAVNESFITIAGNYTEVRKYDPINHVFLSYIPGIGGGMNETKTYEGYWINITTPEVWTVD